MDGDLPKIAGAEVLADKTAGLDAADLPPAVRGKGEDLLIDVVGLCLTARNADYVAAALAGFDDEGACTAIGHARRMSAAGAAFVNGTAAHGEDFDDTFEGGPVHAGAVIVPPVLAAGERHPPDGAAALTRLAVGIETMCRLRLVPPKLLPQARVSTTAAFHALAAAVRGAALPYPCGPIAHASIEWPGRLAARGTDPAAIMELICEVGEGTVHRLWEPRADKQRPANGYGGKFSTPYCIAAAFVRGNVGLGDFTDAAVKDPAVLAVTAKVRYVIDPDNPYPNNFTGHIRAVMRDSSVIEERQPHMRGGAHEPLTRRDT